MKSPKSARARFQAIARGRYVPGHLSVEEAKARLRRADPGLDFSHIFQALDEGDLRRAGSSLAVEVAASRAFAYFYPLMVDAVQLVLDLIPKKDKGE